MPLKNSGWLETMNKMEDIRLFSNLCIKKTRKGSPVSAQETDILFRIVMCEHPPTPLELSRCTNLSKPLISRLLEQLTKKNYIIKEADPSDGRSYCVRITEKGSQELTDTYRYYAGPLLTLEQGLGSEKLSLLLSLVSEANHYLLSQK